MDAYSALVATSWRAGCKVFLAAFIGFGVARKWAKHTLLALAWSAKCGARVIQGDGPGPFFSKLFATKLVAERPLVI
jgi:hypothetical protein